MVQEKNVGRDVFALFLRSGGHLKYARRYLSAEQLDEVDLSRYLGWAKHHPARRQTACAAERCFLRVV